MSKDGSCEDERLRPGEPPTREYITLQELAAWLRISRGSAWTLVFVRGEIPHLRIGDRMVRLARRCRGVPREMPLGRHIGGIFDNSPYVLPGMG